MMARRRRQHAFALAARYPALLVAAMLLGACAQKPLLIATEIEPPLMLVPALTHAGQDQRDRFRAIFCAILERRRDTLPDVRPCDEALRGVVASADVATHPVELGPARRPLTLVFVPGLGWDCFARWLQAGEYVRQHLRGLGHDFIVVDIDGLADSRINANIIRDAVLGLPRRSTEPEVVLLGYSKGAVDALQAVVDYPEMRARLAAVVSLAGAIGGSPLANDATQDEVNLMRLFPGSTCRPEGLGALHSLKPAVRQRWLADHPLPGDVPLYSLIALPEVTRISSLLHGSHAKLSQVDPRNDGQLIFYNQFIPGSTLLGYLNADHLAAGVPVSRHHAVVGRLLTEHNAYPREALFEALLRLIDENH